MRVTAELVTSCGREVTRAAVFTPNRVLQRSGWDFKGEEEGFFIVRQSCSLMTGLIISCDSGVF